MNLNGLNINHLHIFTEVFQSLSMTEAADRLHLTQSGVSQHMKTLESNLGIKLFDRVKQKLIPTAHAKTLFKFCKEGFLQIEQGLSQVVSSSNELDGVVAIGLPIEFGTNILMPLVSQFRRKHPRVRFQFTLDFASVLNEKLLNGDIDFAFVDDYTMDIQVATKKVYDEILDLCILKSELKSYGPVEHSKEYYESLDYVSYQKNAPILRLWFKHHLKSSNVNLNLTMTVMDVWGVARLIHSGMGAGVLPRHIAHRLKKEGYVLHTFDGSGKPVKNSIHLAYVKGRTQSVVVQVVSEYLLEKLQILSKK